MGQCTTREEGVVQRKSSRYAQWSPWIAGWIPSHSGIKWDTTKQSKEKVLGKGQIPDRHKLKNYWTSQCLDVWCLDTNQLEENNLVENSGHGADIPERPQISSKWTKLGLL